MAVCDQEIPQDWTLHPFLEQSDSPNANMWYVLSDHESASVAMEGRPLKEMPCPRLGTSCSVDDNGNLVLFGGATLEKLLDDVHVFNMAKLKWSKLKCGGTAPSPRYEHAAAFYSSINALCVFGGAVAEKPLNDVHILNLATNTWIKVKTNGESPSPRTMHSAGYDDSRLIVFGGGLQGANIVPDPRVHFLDITTHTWTSHLCGGSAPSPRQGHSMVVVGQKLFVFGGMGGSTFYGDLYILDLTQLTWSCPDTAGPPPLARASHGVACVGSRMYVFGGLGLVAAQPRTLQDLHVLDTTTLEWSAVSVQAAGIGARMDLAMGATALRVAPAATPAPRPAASSTQPIQDITDMFGRDGVLLGDTDGIEVTAAIPADKTSEPLGAGGSANDETASPAVPRDSDGDLSSPGTVSVPAAEGDVVPAAEGDVLPGPMALVIFGGVSLEGAVYGDLLALVPS